MIKEFARAKRRGQTSIKATRQIEEIKSAYLSQVSEIHDHLEWIYEMERMANHPVATLKKPLDPPEGYEPVMVFDCGEASFYFERDDELIEADWPFVEDYAWPDDCQQHGIRVE